MTSAEAIIAAAAEHGSRRRDLLAELVENTAERARLEERRDALLVQARELGIGYRPLGQALGMSQEGVRQHLARRGWQEGRR